MYTVTFCAQDYKVGGNPLWHACLLLSKTSPETQQLEVVNNWGFYGLPTTSGDSLIRSIKIKFGLDVDLLGSHGMLRHEEMRFLDQGMGLHGVTFELTEEQFNLLDKRCLDAVAAQKAAIEEIVPKGLRGKPAGQEKIYSHEQYAPEIYKLEKALSAQEGRESRLKPFDLAINQWGPNLKQSNTCKSRAVGLLDGILTQQQMARLTQHPTVPRRSGPMEDLYLYSSGPLHSHTKANGKKVHFRKMEDEGVRLFWAIPPQEMEYFSEEADALKMDAEELSEAKLIVGQLIRLEWVVRNADVEDKYQQDKTKLIEKLNQCYQCFATLKDKKEELPSKKSIFYQFFSPSKTPSKTWMDNAIEHTKHFLLGIDSRVNSSLEKIYNKCPSISFWPKKNNNEANHFTLLYSLLSSWVVLPNTPLKDKIEQAQMLLLTLYSVSVDADLEATDGLEAVQEFQQRCFETQSGSPELPISSAVVEELDCEHVVAYFSDADKKAICTILSNGIAAPPVILREPLDHATAKLKVS